MEKTSSKLNSYHLFTSSNEETLQVVAELKHIGCCPRCVLRFLGEADPHSFRCQPEDIERLFVSEDADFSDGSNKSPCPGCLGILQKFADRDYLLQIVNKVREDGFSFTGYQCSLMLPICLIAREKSIYLHLCKKFSVAYDGKENIIPSVKEIWKWSCGYILSELLEARFQNQGHFDIRMTFNYADFEKELSFLLDADPDTFRRRKQQQKKYSFDTFTRVNVAKGISEMGDTKFGASFSCPPSIPVTECTCDISCTHDSIFVAGRYQKYSRVLSQTPWIVDGKRIFEGSVEDFICDPMTAMFKPSEHRLSSSGREDVDVRMLGTGRPFVIELVNPHCVKFSQPDIKRLQEVINESTRDIQVRDMQIVERVDLNSLKEGEISKTKWYSAICWCEREITQDDIKMLEGMKDLTIHQKTPLRVLHRRSAMTRDRVIYSMKAENMDGSRFKLSLQTQAGTYIKEFVHGDFGRTTPNLCEILKADTDIIDLDVEAVDVDWPPYIDEIPKDDSKANQEEQGQEPQQSDNPTVATATAVDVDDNRGATAMAADVDDNSGAMAADVDDNRGATAMAADVDDNSGAMAADVDDNSGATAMAADVDDNRGATAMAADVNDDRGATAMAADVDDDSGAKTEIKY